MSLSLVELHQLIPQLDELLRGGQIQKIFQPTADHLLLYVYRGSLHHLMVSIQPETKRMHLTQRSFTPPQVPSSFVMKLRREILNGRIQSIITDMADRVVRVEISKGETRFTLLVELTGHHANVFLLDAFDTILAAMKVAKSFKRSLEIGVPYQMPLRDRQTMGTDQMQNRFSTQDEVDEQYQRTEEKLAIQRLERALSKTLLQARKKAQRTLDKVAAEVERAEDARHYRELGELLIGQQHRVTRGMTSVMVDDYFAPDLGEREIALDPKLSAMENAQLYFKRYRKYHDAKTTIVHRKSLLEERLNEIGSLLTRLSASVHDIEGLQELEQEFLGIPWLSSHTAVKKKIWRLQSALPYREFTSHDGLPILVGKSSRDNDRLTFRFARGNDIWMHAQQVAGSHVVVRLGKNQALPQETLLDAATLAAHYSKGAKEDSLEVIYTYRKHVHHLKGAPAGKVTVSQFKTLYIKREADRLERLLATR